MTAAPPPYTSQQYALDDHSRTLFPLTTNKVVFARALPRIEEYLVEIFAAGEIAAFLPQQRCYASKSGFHLRRTAALDPVASYFIYDLIFRHRKKLGINRADNRRSFGYRFALGRPVAPSASFGEFRAAVREASGKFRHAISFDISSYFNSLYQHDLAEWFEASIDAADHKAFGQYLRECNRGRSLDCLPHGYHPCKAIGAAFLNDIDTSVQVGAGLMIRFMDDFYLFDDDERRLTNDFVTIQHLLGERGLTVNASKTKRDDEVLAIAPGTIDDIKVELLTRRRAVVIDISGEETVEEVSEEQEDDPLSEEQLEYLMTLLHSPDIDESDAELVLTVLKTRGEDVLEHLTGFLRRFPGLSRRIYHYSAGVEDVTELTGLLEKFVAGELTATEDQLFWIAKIAEDFLGSTDGYYRLLYRIYEHPKATEIVQAKVLEVGAIEAGFQDIREKHLQGSSDWRAWASIVGSAGMPKGNRNQMLKYVAKGSRMNYIVASAVMND